MKIGKFNVSVNVLIGVLVAAFFGLSLLMRVALPYHDIVTADGLKYASNDAYYYMRLVDNQVHNFPSLTDFDPFFIYPGGNGVGGTLFFVWMQAFIVWIIGLGSPSQHLIDAVCIYFPPLLAALTVIPVYFIGKNLFNRWAGLIAAIMMAVLPGEYIGRTILGSNDTPGAEVFLVTTALAFLIAAIKHASERQLTLASLIKREGKIITKPLVLSALGGLFLGMYLNTWFGGLLFVFITCLYLVVQFVVNHLRRRSSEYLGVVGIAFFVVAFLVFFPFSPSKELSYAIVVALLIPLVLGAISMAMLRKAFAPALYPLVLLVLAGALIGIVYAIDATVIKKLWGEFNFVFFPGGSTARTTQEMQPFLFPMGTFSTAVAWGNFTTSFFLLPTVPIPGFALISLAVTVWMFFRHRGENGHWALFIIWCAIMLWATLTQRRFAYYFVVNVAILSAYLSWLVIWLAGFRRLLPVPEAQKPAPQAEKARETKKNSPAPDRMMTVYKINGILAIIVVFFFVVFPNIMKAKEVAAHANYAPSDAWQSSLVWMKDNTPEPMGDPEAYYHLYQRPAAGEVFTYPDSAYGVTSWWDFGYWISKIAHRLPTANPSQDPTAIKRTAEFLLSADEASAEEIVQKFKMSYVICDYDMPLSKFWAIVNWAGLPPEDYNTLYYVLDQNQLVPVEVYNVKYYQTLLVRMFNFDGRAVADGRPVVVAYEDRTTSSGRPYRLVQEVQEFTSYQKALGYIESQPDGKYDICGADPFTSPVPLEALKNFQLVYSSEDTINWSNNGTTSEVKVFQYLKH